MASQKKDNCCASVGQQKLQNKPCTQVNLTECQGDKNVIPLSNTVKSDKELNEQCALKFGGKQTSIGPDQVSSETTEKDHSTGNYPMNSNEESAKFEKLKGVEGEMEKEQERKKIEKLYNHQPQSLFPDPKA